MRSAKIICTIGPSSSSPRTLERMIRAGMNVARLNFSHGSHDQHAHSVKTIRKLAEKYDAPVAIVQDLRGLKIRVGPLKNGTDALMLSAETSVGKHPVEALKMAEKQIS